MENGGANFTKIPLKSSQFVFLYRTQISSKNIFLVEQILEKSEFLTKIWTFDHNLDFAQNLDLCQIF